MSPSIPILDLEPEIALLRDELRGAFDRVLDERRFILGPEVERFEAECAAYLGAEHAIGVNSGTDALIIALRAMGVGPGDEVITTPFTFIATPEAISQVGATVVFADIDPRTFNIDPAAVERAITDRTRAIMPVHLFGQPADLSRLTALAERHGLGVVEDAAQAFGATCLDRKAGTLGDAGAFSFFPTKNLGGFGDGGLIATHDARVAEAARMLRVHGSRKKYHNEEHGYNSRLDALHAALLAVKLKHIEAFNRGRRLAASRYDAMLADVPGLIPPAPGPGHVYHQYTVRIADGRRDGVRQALADEGIATMVYYPVPSHRLPVYADHAGAALPEAERAAAEVLSLPIWPSIDEATQRRVCDAISRAASRPDRAF